MPFLILVLVALLLAILVGPQLWVQYVIAKHGVHRPDLPGTGSELAQHLIEHFQLTGVRLETTREGDHYDTQSRTVRLNEKNFHGTSLSAVAIAAHEIGHAIQHQRGERLLALRQSLVVLAMWSDRVAMAAFLLAPFLGLLTHAPAAFLLMSLVGFALLTIRVVTHLVTLPVEMDASFKKALPILEQGGYLKSEDLPAARSILKAAAMTYVAAALMSLINMARLARLGR